MNKDQAQGSAREAAGKMEKSFGRATDDARASAEGLADQAGGAAQRVYGDAKEAAQSAADYGRAQYEEGSRAVVQRVEEQPFVTLAMAAAVGFVIARII